MGKETKSSEKENDFSAIQPKSGQMWDIFITIWMTKEAPLKSGLSSSLVLSYELFESKLAIIAPAATASNGKADKVNHGSSVIKLELI